MTVADVSTLRRMVSVRQMLENVGIRVRNHKRADCPSAEQPNITPKPPL